MAAHKFNHNADCPPILIPKPERRYDYTPHEKLPTTFKILAGAVALVYFLDTRPKPREQMLEPSIATEIAVNESVMPPLPRELLNYLKASYYLKREALSAQRQ